MVKAVGLVPVSLWEGRICLLLGEKRLAPGAGDWTGPSGGLKGPEEEAFPFACEVFRKQIWPKMAPVPGSTEGWEPYGTFDAGLSFLGVTRWFLVRLPGVPKSLELRFTDRDKMRLGAYTGNWPFGLTDFKDLKWVSLDSLPRPLGIPSELVKTAGKLTPQDFTPGEPVPGV